MSSQPPYYGQPPPPQGYGAPPPGGPPNTGAPYQQYPPPGAPPGQAPGQAPGQGSYQQPYYGYQPAAVSPQPGSQYQPPPPGGQPGQYQNQQYPPNAQYGQQPPQNAPYSQPPPQGAPYGQPPPQGAPYGQPPPQGAPYGQQPPQHAPYGQPPPSNAPYGQQPPPPSGQYGPQPPYGGQQQTGYAPPPPQGYPPQGQQQWQAPPPQHPPHGASGYGAPGYSAPPVQPTPASQGYDVGQKAYVQPVHTPVDLEDLRRAMKGMGCDEKALIRVFTKPTYANPWALQQLVRDYNSRFLRNLIEDIKSETRSDLETALLALLRGPLAHDVFLLDKSLNRMGTDEDTLMDVLLDRNNADMRAIAAEYKRTTHRELLTDIKEDVDDALFRLCSMLVAGTRAEDAAPALPHDIDAKVTELQRATEGMIGANAVSVAQIFASSNNAQIAALSDAYHRKYHRRLEDVIEKEFRGDMEDALLRMLMAGKDRAASDAMRLRESLTKRKDKLFINRMVSLYWDQPRQAAAKDAYRRKYGTTLARDVRDLLKGDLEDMMLALIREK